MLFSAFVRFWFSAFRGYGFKGRTTEHRIRRKTQNRSFIIREDSRISREKGKVFKRATALNRQLKPLDQWGSSFLRLVSGEQRKFASDLYPLISFYRQDVSEMGET